ncbi:MAG: hypothetical protein C0478_13785 [Planctomyces sp.]|nr:hypothetical protein [Planctomyces sp.]
MNDVTTRLLERVRWRMAVANWGELCLLNLLVLVLAVTVLSLVNRFTSFVPDTMIWPVWAAIVPAAALLAGIFFRRPTLAEAAQKLDQEMGQKDLFLTVARLSSSVGEYQPVVLAAAHEQAGKAVPSKVAPWQVSKKIRPLLGLIAIAGAVQLFVPQFDLLGNRAQAAVIEQRSARLATSRKLTEIRKAELKRAQEERTEPSDEELAENLKMTFQKMDPAQKEQNRKELLREQKELSQQWKQKSADKAAQAASRASSDEAQKLGNEETETLRKLAKEAARTGDTEELKKKIDEMKEQLEKLAKTEDPVEKAEQLQELKKRMEQMEKLAREELGSEAMAKALERARQQSQLAQQTGASAAEALSAAMESLELSEMEMSEAMESMQDMQDLEKALKALQAAKKLNDLKPLDGGQCKGCKSLADYEKLYKEMLAQCNGEGEGQGKGSGKGKGKGNGSGMGGEGIGQGGKAEEDDSVETDFVNEKSQSQVTAGKMLLSLKSQGLGEEGQAKQDYQKATTAVKQGVAEAIQQEQIPPGYHESIKSYFDQVAPPK